MYRVTDVPFLYWSGSTFPARSEIETFPALLLNIPSGPLA